MKWFDVWRLGKEIRIEEHEPSNLNSDSAMRRAGWEHVGRIPETVVPRTG